MPVFIRLENNNNLIEIGKFQLTNRPVLAKKSAL
jgi:hypothetical protein